MACGSLAWAKALLPQTDSSHDQEPLSREHAAQALHSPRPAWILKCSSLQSTVVYRGHLFRFHVCLAEIRQLGSRQLGSLKVGSQVL